MWCWETEQYERAESIEEAAAACRAAREAEALRAAEAEAWEQEKAGMNKRQLKKALEKDRVEAEARREAEAEAEVEREAEAKAARAALEADPVALHRAQYQGQLTASVGDTVRSGLLSFLQMVRRSRSSHEGAGAGGMWAQVGCGRGWDVGAGGMWVRCGQSAAP